MKNLKEFYVIPKSNKIDIYAKLLIEGFGIKNTKYNGNEIFFVVNLDSKDVNDVLKGFDYTIETDIDAEIIGQNLITHKKLSNNEKFSIHNILKGKK